MTEETVSNIETERLTIRRFTAGDWSDVQALAIDKESSKGAIYDDTWPTSDDETKGLTEYFAEHDDRYFAVRLKKDQRIIGLITFNDIDPNQQLDFGHIFHTDCQDDDVDREALGRMITFAFEKLDIQSIVTKNRPEWTEQTAPLRSLGLQPVTDESRNLEVSRGAWRSRWL